MKECRSCKETKAFEQFYWSKRDNRYDSYCKDCQKEQAEKWRKANPEKRSATIRKYHINKRKGVTQEQYNKLLADQLELCAICCEFMDEPHIDTDHKTGRVRGLLCMSCNVGIGHLKDDPKILQSAINYLERDE